MKAWRWAASSSWNWGSAFASVHASSSSRQADINVSGTYWPPKWPNLPRVIGAPDGRDEGAHQLRIFHAQPRLDAAGDVHPVWPVAPHDVANISWSEPAGQEDPARGQQRAGELPVPGAAGTAT